MSRGSRLDDVGILGLRVPTVGYMHLPFPYSGFSACRSPCHVVYTEFRPTPLQHFAFPAGCDGLFLVVDERGAFRSDNFTKAVAALTAAAPEPGAAPMMTCAGTPLPWRTQKPRRLGWQDARGNPDLECNVCGLKIGPLAGPSYPGFVRPLSACDSRQLQNIGNGPEEHGVHAGSKKGDRKGASGVNGKKSEESDMFKLVRMIMQRNFDPVSRCPPKHPHTHPAGVYSCVFGIA